ncbi:BspA family leucine-rich repeat surface protein [Butyrivibrio sp. WCD2001]|uniref:BspA family leucine-rich repeat surface protein n=1 Tax=Butyrivibrio sp. WCD2001 TaxID=1280681 RepID=UPI000426AE9A|nr:BspA family leucine-rich repeat surface protein [Butyrivibrio sp. WCD2001]
MERNRKSLVWVIAAFLCVALFFGCSSGNFKIKAEAASRATLVTGNNFNKALKKFVNNKVSSFTDEDETIEHVIFMAKGSTPNKKLPSKNIGTANNSVMAYYDSEKKTVYIYSAANTIFLNVDSANMFYGYTAVKSIEFNGRINTSRVTNFNGMFGLCHKLEVLDVSNFDTSKATNLSGMFNHCDVLKTIDISNFNTSKVTSMHSMFFWCSAVEKLDFSNFDTSKVEYFTQMFVGCYGLESLDLSSFKTSNVTEMYRTFDCCKNLKSLDLSNFDTSKVTNMKWMFEGCYNLENLNISSFNTSKVTDCTEMLNRCDKLKVLDAPKIIGKAIALPGEFGLDNNKDGKADNATVYTKLAVKKSGTSNRYINLRKEEEKKPDPSEGGESGNEGGSESGNQGDGSESGKPEVKPTTPNEASAESSVPIDSANQSNPSEQAAQATNPATPQVEAEAAEKIDGKQKKTSISKLIAGKKSITVTWKKQTGIKGYEIQYTTDKNFNKDVNAVTIVKAKTTSKTIKKLKTNKKYYVRIRTYKKSGAEKIYSKWSKSKSVKVK